MSHTGLLRKLSELGDVGFDEPLELKRKEKIKKEKFCAEHIIPYEDGHAFIGFAKIPLMKSDNGVGFKGVKIQSVDRTKMQCAECGNWFPHVGRHVRVHGMKADDYRAKFGLNITTGLVADSQSEQLMNLRNAFLSKLSDSELPINFVKRKHGKGSMKKRRNMEALNNKGNCPEQLKARMVNFIHRFKRLPGSSVDSFSYGAYVSSFGSMNNALRSYGLPTRKQAGSGYTLYEFLDGSIYKKKPVQSFDALYDLMLKKCPILTNK